MPALPSWYPKLPLIISQLRALSIPFVDRAAVQKLFGIRERRTQQLFRKWGVYRFGNASVISRAWLIEHLERIASDSEYRQESVRRDHLVAQIDRVRRDVKVKRVLVVPNGQAEMVRNQQCADLPAAIELTPGKLTIEFQGTEDFLRHIGELVYALHNDYPKVMALIEGMKRDG